MNVAARILVTGFTPFPTAPENPTEDLVEAIKSGDVTVPAGATIRAQLLPTEFRASFETLMSAVQEFRPHAVVEFGLSARAIGFTLERTARNEWSAEIPDNSGFRPDTSEIEPSAPSTFESRLPLVAIFDGLKVQGLPVEYSDSAGAYVCNHLFFRTMQMAPDMRPAQAGFIHVPYLEEQRDRLQTHGRIEGGLSALTREQLFQGAATILQTVADHASTSGHT